MSLMASILHGFASRSQTNRCFWFDNSTYSKYSYNCCHRNGHLCNYQQQCVQVEDDLKNGVDGAVPIPADNAGKEEVIAALVANVEAMIKADRKITALKQLQVCN